MKKWKFTSYQDGKEITYSGLSRDETVRVINRVMTGREPFAETEVHELEQRETVAAEQRIAA